MSTGSGLEGREVPGAVMVAGEGGRESKKKRKQKARRARRREGDVNSALQSDIGSQIEANGLEKNVASEDGNPAAVTFGVNGTDKPSKNEASESSMLVRHTDSPSKTTEAEWTEGSVPDATERVLLHLNQDDDDDSTSTRRKEIEDWLACQTSHPYHNLPNKLRVKIVDYILGYKYPEEQPDRDNAVRLIIWRAAIRANYFWVDPDTGLPVGKPKPIRAPDGVFASDFNVFVMCCAERADRVGRDLPEPEHVKKVEDDIRKLFKAIEKQGLKEKLEHFAFLLLVDEGQGRELTAEEMQERMGLAFSDVAFSWDEFEIVKCVSTILPDLTKGSKLVVAETIWQDMSAQL